MQHRNIDTSVYQVTADSDVAANMQVADAFILLQLQQSTAEHHTHGQHGCPFVVPAKFSRVN